MNDMLVENLATASIKHHEAHAVVVCWLTFGAKRPQPSGASSRHFFFAAFLAAQ